MPTGGVLHVRPAGLHWRWGLGLELAVPAGHDAAETASRIRRSYERFRESRVVASCVRPVVAASWRRCASAGAPVMPGTGPRGGEFEEYRARHPLTALLPLFSELLGWSAGEEEHIFAITDAGGTLLWVRGHSGTLAAAEEINFVEGAAWSEARAGTNAPGTALLVGQPVQIFEAEHYDPAVQRWSCAAAPIRDPAGLLLGAIDITGGDGIASPGALALVRATARAAESELVRLAWTGHHNADLGTEGPGLALREPDAFRLAALGRDNALVETGGAARRLSRRHSEIMVILATTPGGLSGERLAVELCEEELHPSTIRAEMTRLRTVLGTGMLGSSPYRLLRPACPDFRAVRDLLARGRVREAVAAYQGPLLPSSQAPAITGQRAALEQQLRGAVLGSGDASLIRRWVDAPWGAGDGDAWLALARRLPGGSPQRAAAAARARAIDLALAAPGQRVPA